MLNRIHKSPHALEIPFDNSTNGFTADIIQQAIEEARTSVSFLSYQESLGDSSTTSTTVWSTKVTITTSSLPSGNYILYYACVHRTASANRETDIRVQRNAVTEFEVRNSLIRTQGRNPVSGFLYFSSISGVNTITLDFKVGGTATTSTISDARLIFWRVG